MNLVVERVSSAVGEKAVTEALSIDDVILGWADECLREALQAGRMDEAPFYKRALEHAGAVKSGRQTKGALEHNQHSAQGSPMRPAASRAKVRTLRLVAAA